MKYQVVRCFVQSSYFKSLFQLSSFHRSTIFLLPVSVFVYVKNLLSVLVTAGRDLDAAYTTQTRIIPLSSPNPTPLIDPRVMPTRTPVPHRPRSPGWRRGPWKGEPSRRAEGSVAAGGQTHGWGGGYPMRVTHREVTAVGRVNCGCLTHRRPKPAHCTQ